jgi:hypothetical protein
LGRFRQATLPAGTGPNAHFQQGHDDINGPSNDGSLDASIHSPRNAQFNEHERSGPHRQPMEQAQTDTSNLATKEDIAAINRKLTEIMDAMGSIHESIKTMYSKVYMLENDVKEIKDSLLPEYPSYPRNRPESAMGGSWGGNFPSNWDSEDNQPFYLARGPEPMDEERQKDVASYDKVNERQDLEKMDKSQVIDQCINLHKEQDDLRYKNEELKEEVKTLKLDLAHNSSEVENLGKMLAGLQSLLATHNITLPTSSQ